MAGSALTDATPATPFLGQLLGSVIGGPSAEAAHDPFAGSEFAASSNLGNHYGTGNAIAAATVGLSQGGMDPFSGAYGAEQFLSQMNGLNNLRTQQQQPQQTEQGGMDPFSGAYGAEQFLSQMNGLNNLRAQQQQLV